MSESVTTALEQDFVDRMARTLYITHLSKLGHPGPEQSWEDTDERHRNSWRGVAAKAFELSEKRLESELG